MYSSWATGCWSNLQGYCLGIKVYELILVTFLGVLNILSGQMVARIYITGREVEVSVVIIIIITPYFDSD